MTEINKHEINISQASGKKIQPEVKISNNEKTQDIVKDYKEEAAAPGWESAGRAQVMLNSIKKADKADNIEADIQKILNNPKLVEQSDILFNAAEKAGIPYPQAASFATSELG